MLNFVKENPCFVYKQKKAKKTALVIIPQKNLKDILPHTSYFLRNKIYLFLLAHFLKILLKFLLFFIINIICFHMATVFIYFMAFLWIANGINKIGQANKKIINRAKNTIK